MKLWISSEMEGDIAEDFLIARNKIEEDLAEFLEPRVYELELDSLDCIAIVRNDSKFKEMHPYSQKKSMDFRLVIDYQEFKSSSLDHRKLLILNMLLRVV